MKNKTVDESYEKHIAQKITALRKQRIELGFSQSDISKLTAISTVTISRLEGFKIKDPSYYVIYKYDLVINEGKKREISSHL